MEYTLFSNTTFCEASMMDFPPSSWVRIGFVKILFLNTRSVEILIGAATGSYVPCTGYRSYLPLPPTASYVSANVLL
ncbi:hypothetical protein D3C71_1733820 [compost metagenome]